MREGGELGTCVARKRLAAPTLCVTVIRETASRSPRLTSSSASPSQSVSPVAGRAQREGNPPRTRVQAAPAAIVCTGHDSTCRFASPIKRDASSRLFIAFPQRRGSSEAGLGSRVGLVFRAFWPHLASEPELRLRNRTASTNVLNPHLRDAAGGFPARLGASGSAAVLFTAALS